MDDIENLGSVMIHTVEIKHKLYLNLSILFSLLNMAILKYVIFYFSRVLFDLSLLYNLFYETTVLFCTF